MLIVMANGHNAFYENVWAERPHLSVHHMLLQPYLHPIYVVLQAGLHPRYVGLNPRYVGVAGSVARVDAFNDGLKMESHVILQLLTYVLRSAKHEELLDSRLCGCNVKF